MEVRAGVDRILQEEPEGTGRSFVLSSQSPTAS